MKTLIEPFKIKTVEEIPITTVEEREQYLKEAHYNPFYLKSEHITIDLLTDSGTTAMSAKQWAALMDGDESYAGSRSYYKFEDAVKNITGFKHIIPTHQGRAAEKILFSVMAGEGKTVPNNTHFDTTRGNLEYIKANPVDLPVDIGIDPEYIDDFKGNMDLEKLEAVIKEYGKENIPLGMITVTNNSGGGQPVSMKNIRETSELLKKHNIPFYLDCCRFAENAYFIKQREKGYENKTILEISQEMFSYADGATMSAKKDGLSNMGGFIATNDDKVAEQAKTLLIITEGYITYGGLTRRDMEALAQGFKEVMDEKYLAYRIGQVKYLGDELMKNGVPILMPTGGHAVYLDAKRFAPHIKPQHFPGQSILLELYRISGIRAVEIGSLMFGQKDAEGNFIPANMDLVRLAIPRRVYTKSHMDYIVEAVTEVYKNRNNLKPMKIEWEAQYLRHFTVKMDYIP
jgi:tyrosine phenol-lyase